MKSEQKKKFFLLTRFYIHKLCTTKAVPKRTAFYLFAKSMIFYLSKVGRHLPTLPLRFRAW
jgi:hypothetical protein